LKIGERIETIHFDTLVNSYFLHERSIIILDSLGTYLAEKKGSSLVLTNSPKINLERVIANTKPKIIIADGSNYISYINRWKVTCMERKIPFHYTGEKGFYSFE